MKFTFNSQRSWVILLNLLFHPDRDRKKELRKFRHSDRQVETAIQADKCGRVRFRSWQLIINRFHRSEDAARKGTRFLLRINHYSFSVYFKLKEKKGEMKMNSISHGGYMPDSDIYC